MAKNKVSKTPAIDSFIARFGPQKKVDEKHNIKHHADTKRISSGFLKKLGKLANKKRL